MARIIENIKGFKVIEITAREMLKIGCGDICDSCGESSQTGYYVAVLNRWFCPPCYADWAEHATNYATESKAEKRIEQRNFEYYKMLLGID